MNDDEFDVTAGARPAIYRPTIGFWQICNMCFGFVGIQFAFALQNSNVSRIFQTLGATVEAIPLLWIAAPLTGLLVQPVIGYWSDRTWGRFGRRRPYFVAGALLAALALVAMPNAGSLWSAAALLWLLDGSINVALGPFRSFVGDQLSSAQRPAGYAAQTFFIAAGSVVASVLPWLLARLGVDNAGAPGVVPDTVRYAFHIGAAILLGTMAWTVLSTREYSPATLAGFDDAAPAPPTPLAVHDVRVAGVRWMIAGSVATVATWLARVDVQLYLLAGGMIAYGATQVAVSFSRGRNLVAAIVADLRVMPTTMRKLAVVQYFSWFAMFAMWIYMTAAVTEVHFGARDPHSVAYNEGANWVGVLFAAYNGFAIVAAIVIPLMTRRLGLRMSHLINLWLGGFGLISFLFISDPHWLLLSMAGVGFAWASILSLPYALLSDSVPAAKMGVYMGLFNLFIVVPQIVAATVLGFLLRTFFHNAAIDALLIGGVSLIVAGVCVLRVRDP